MAGLSFLPSANQTPEDRNSAGALAPGQSPIQTLSLNLPRVVGARAAAPSSILAGRGGSAQGGSTGGSAEQMVLKALMAAMMQGGGQASPDLLSQIRALFGTGPAGGNLPTLTPTVGFGGHAPGSNPIELTPNTPPPQPANPMPAPAPPAPIPPPPTNQVGVFTGGSRQG